MSSWEVRLACTKRSKKEWTDGQTAPVYKRISALCCSLIIHVCCRIRIALVLWCECPACGCRTEKHFWNLNPYTAVATSQESFYNIGYISNDPGCPWMRYLVHLDLDMPVADRLVLVAGIPGDRQECSGTKKRAPHINTSLSYSRRPCPFPNG